MILIRPGLIINSCPEQKQHTSPTSSISFCSPSTFASDFDMSRCFLRPFSTFTTHRSASTRPSEEKPDHTQADRHALGNGSFINSVTRDAVIARAKAIHPSQILYFLVLIVDISFDLGDVTLSFTHFQCIQIPRQASIPSSHGVSCRRHSCTGLLRVTRATEQQ